MASVEPFSFPSRRASGGDVIREINRKPVRSVEDFERLVRGLSSKQGVLMLIMRGKATLFLSIKPE